MEIVYKIRNIRTGEVKGNYKTLIGARRACDRLDNKYGAYVWKVCNIW